jgi:hypothetical protein
MKGGQFHDHPRELVGLNPVNFFSSALLRTSAAFIPDIHEVKWNKASCSNHTCEGVLGIYLFHELVIPLCVMDFFGKVRRRLARSPVVTLAVL